MDPDVVLSDLLFFIFSDRWDEAEGAFSDLRDWRETGRGYLPDPACLRNLKLPGE